MNGLNGFSELKWEITGFMSKGKQINFEKKIIKKGFFSFANG